MSMTNKTALSEYLTWHALYTYDSSVTVELLFSVSLVLLARIQSLNLQNGHTLLVLILSHETGLMFNLLYLTAGAP